MSLEFADILQGLMRNRHLSSRVVSRASARDESTINQLLNGTISPSVEILQDIAPILQMPLADLLAIAGISKESSFDQRKSYTAASEIGELVALASWLPAAQIDELIELARTFKERNSKEGNYR